MTARLELARDRILGFRRRAAALDEKLPLTRGSLRRAAWAGLADSMPRAALISIHARVAGTGPTTWEDPALVQLWGPRFSDYVVAAVDLPVFSLGRLPDDPRGRARALDTAERLDRFLAGRRMPFGRAGHELGVAPNSLRYGAASGRLVIRWDGARQPEVWTVPAPTIDPRRARLELARRYLRILGPGTVDAFRRWAGVRAPTARSAFEGLGDDIVPVRSPVGDGWILAADEAGFREPPGPAAAARLLPSGDAHYLLWGADRALLVPDAANRSRLWTPRVWPGALLLDGEVAGTWSRTGADIAIAPWRPLTPGEREAVAAEAAAIPLPGAPAIRVAWAG